MDPDRAHKLADRIAQIVAEMLERRVKDPRLGFVTVTDARLTGDLREATVYYTVYGSPQEQADTAAALASATGLIRSEVGRQTGLRHTPSLSFVRDTLPEGAAHLEELVARARDADAALAAARRGARPAGEADPYRPAPGTGHEGADSGPGEGPAAGPGEAGGPGGAHGPGDTPGSGEARGPGDPHGGSRPGEAAGTWHSPVGAAGRGGARGRGR